MNNINSFVSSISCQNLVSGASAVSILKNRVIPVALMAIALVGTLFAYVMRMRGARTTGTPRSAPAKWESAQRVNILKKIPLELSTKILDHLNDQDTCSIFLTCKRLSALSKNDMIWSDKLKKLEPLIKVDEDGCSLTSFVDENTLYENCSTKEIYILNAINHRVRSLDRECLHPIRSYENKSEVEEMKVKGNRLSDHGRKIIQLIIGPKKYEELPYLCDLKPTEYSIGLYKDGDTLLQYLYTYKSHNHPVVKYRRGDTEYVLIDYIYHQNFKINEKKNISKTGRETTALFFFARTGEFVCGSSKLSSYIYGTQNIFKDSLKMRIQRLIYHGKSMVQPEDLNDYGRDGEVTFQLPIKDDK